jgi:hypothetical protein
MTRQGVTAGVLVVVTAISVAAWGRAELPRHHARPRALPGIPNYDYRMSVNPPPTVTAMSLPKVAVESPAPGARPRPKAYAFQFAEPRLQADHCFLSRVAVALHEDGDYQITFRADQNPQPQAVGVAGDIRSPLRPGEVIETTLQTSQLKRNLFVVRVRGYAAPQRDGKANLVPAAPALVEFPVEPFWVQKGEPYTGNVCGNSWAVRKYFHLIERVEVEFTYR